MRMSWVFLPLKGTWDWALVKIQQAAAGIGGTTVVSGILLLTPNTVLEAQVQLGIQGGASVEISPGSTVLVID